MTNSPRLEPTIKGVRSVPITYYDICGDKAFFAKFDPLFNPLNNKDHLFFRLKTAEDTYQYVLMDDRYPTSDFALFLAFVIARDYNSLQEATSDLYGLSEKIAKIYDDREIHTGNVEKLERIQKLLKTFASAIPVTTI